MTIYIPIWAAAAALWALCGVWAVGIIIRLDREKTPNVPAFEGWRDLFFRAFLLVAGPIGCFNTIVVCRRVHPFSRQVTYSQLCLDHNSLAEAMAHCDLVDYRQLLSPAIKLAYSAGSAESIVYFCVVDAKTEAYRHLLAGARVWIDQNKMK